MGIKLRDVAGLTEDLNIARMEIFSDGDNPDNWELVVHWQKALYQGDSRVTNPEFGVERVAYRYGDVKNDVLPSGTKVSDLFPKVREAGYYFRQKKIDQDNADREAAEAARRESEAPAPATPTT